MNSGPLRSFEQYRRKVEAMLNDPVSAGGGMRRRLREFYDAGRLGELYGELTSDDAAVERGLAAGELARDERLRDFMAAVGDPLAGDPAPRLVEPGAAELERERAELELDVMHVLSRTERMLMIRYDEARREANRLEAEVARLRSRAKRGARRRRSPLRRLRRRLGALAGRG